MIPGLDVFKEVWLVAFATVARPGEQQDPLALAARGCRSGQVILVGPGELRGRREPPYPVGPDSLVVAFAAEQEIGSHLALRWPLPARLLGLQAEFRWRTSGRERPRGDGLLGALTWYGLDIFDAIAAGAEPRLADPTGALRTCEAGVRALGRLVEALGPELDLPRALLRGRYLAAVARMEAAGVPLDVPMLNRLRRGRQVLADRLIRDVDKGFGVYDGRVLRADRLGAWAEARGIAWPRTGSGAPATDDETLRAMALEHKEVGPLRRLRLLLAQIPLLDPAVGSDGRNRTALNSFYSVTGRNQPGYRSILAQPGWARGLVQPGPGRALAWIPTEGIPTNKIAG